MVENELITAHEFSAGHKKALMRDRICGCFFCLTIFDPKEIAEWIDDPGGTAICPYCGVDAVLGESSGYPITPDFLEAMKEQWFF